MERVRELDVAAKGQKKHLTQYAISGLAFSPSYVWLDEANNFFAQVSSWMSVIRAGWEDFVATLDKAQDATLAARNLDLARRLAHKPAGTLAIRHVSLFDSQSASQRPGMTVVISGNRIQQVAPDSKAKIPANAQVIDAAGKMQDTRTPARFTVIAQNAPDLDLHSDRVRQFIQLLKQRHTDVDPTLDAFEGMFVARAGEVSPTCAEVAARMPIQVRREFLRGGLPVPEGMDQRYRDAFQAMLNMVGELYRAGIPIEAGTDQLAGFSLHRELELYLQAGIPAPKVLQLATLGAARIMSRDRDLGSIAPAKLADMILVDGDPIAGIGNIRRVTTVVKDGVVYEVPELDRALGIMPSEPVNRK